MTDALEILLRTKLDLAATLEGTMEPNSFEYYGTEKNNEYGKFANFGKFELERRLSCCYISHGFLKQIGLEFERCETHDHPEKLSADHGYLAIGTVWLPMKVAGSKARWLIECRIMPYPHCHLNIFADKRSEDPELFDLGLGAPFFEEFDRIERQTNSTNQEPMGGVVSVPATMKKPDTETKFENLFKF